MGVMVGFLGLLVALAALWLASETRSSVERQTEDFLKAHVHTLRDSVSEMAEDLNGLTETTTQLHEGLSTVKVQQAQLMARVETLTETVTRLESALDEQARKSS